MNSWEAWKCSYTFKKKIVHLLDKYNMPILTIAEACGVNEKIIRDNLRNNGKFSKKNISLIEEGLKEIYTFIGEDEGT